MPPWHNRLLAAIPVEESDSVLAGFEQVDLQAGQVLVELDQPLDRVYFPTRGVVALLTVMSDGSTVQAGLTGNEGMLGIPSSLHSGHSPYRALVELPGQALALPRAEFMIRLADSPYLQSLLGRYEDALIGLLVQSTACGRFHTVRERTARWLLMLHDRSGANGPMPGLTQELLAQIVGVHRPTMTMAARELRADGLIDYRRGQVLVTDREGLEKSACECYERIEQRFSRLTRETGAVGSD